jgi:hypothetical protein
MDRLGKIALRGDCHGHKPKGNRPPRRSSAEALQEAATQAHYCAAQLRKLADALSEAAKAAKAEAHAEGEAAV